MKRLLVIILFIPTILFSQQDKNWVLNADSNDNYFAPTLASGLTGFRVSPNPLEVEQILLNGVFDKYGNDNVQCILPGINFASLYLTTDSASSKNMEHILNWRQFLNMKEAFLETCFDLSDELNVTHRIRSLRHMPYSVLIDAELVALKDITVKVGNSMEFVNPLKNGRSTFRVFNKRRNPLPVLTSVAESPAGKHTIASACGFLFGEEKSEVTFSSNNNSNKQSFSINLKKGEKFTFSLIGSIVSTADFQDPVTEAERQCIFAMLEGPEKLIQNHKRAWEKLWSTDILIEGDNESQKDIRFALFNLYSSISENSSYSIPPMGLSSTGYYGHIFWDAELWMYPPLLVLNPDLARPMTDYRLKNLEAAGKKASSYGFKGVMFPWEADDKGEESTPSWALTGPFEHHITAVVGLALWNYYSVTSDTDWLKKEAFPAIKEIAGFWQSRSTKDENGNYNILNVVGADEYAENVDNNAFTNGSVKKLFQIAIDAARILNEPVEPVWQEMADNIVIEKFDDGTIKNYKNYNGEKTKQADVNLLTYPLNLVTDKETILKNLEYYQQKVDPRGPAMTQSVYSVIYSRLGMKEKAWDLFLKSYKANQRPPYGVLAEGTFDNNPYFMTAAGGMLQSVLFGFCGMEITADGIKFNEPNLPVNWKSVTLKGIGKEKQEIRINN